MTSHIIYIIIGLLLCIIVAMLFQSLTQNVKEGLEASHLADYFPTNYTKRPRGTTAPTGTKSPTGTTAPMGTSVPSGTSEPTGTLSPTGTMSPLETSSTLTTTMNDLLQFV